MTCDRAWAAELASVSVELRLGHSACLPQTATLTRPARNGLSYQSPVPGPQLSHLLAQNFILLQTGRCKSEGGALTGQALVYACPATHLWCPGALGAFRIYIVAHPHPIHLNRDTQLLSLAAFFPLTKLCIHACASAVRSLPNTSSICYLCYFCLTGPARSARS